jgi:hypothetical protein
MLSSDDSNFFQNFCFLSGEREFEGCNKLCVVALIQDLRLNVLGIDTIKFFCPDIDNEFLLLFVFTCEIASEC